MKTDTSKKPVSKKERDLLRALATQVAEIAALPVQQRRIAEWKAMNALKPVRPMVMIDQVPWHEMDVDGELTLQTRHPFCQPLEIRLRRQLYAWKHMRADMVVEPVLDIAKTILSTGYGVQMVEDQAVGDPKNSVVGHFFHDQLKTEADLDKIRTPEISLDAAATARDEERAHAIFDGILDVRMQGRGVMLSIWDRISTWRGVENILYDLADRPEFVHQIMSRVTAAASAELDQLEAQGLLIQFQSTIHCTGAYTDELPAPGFDPAHPRPRDLWTCGMAQLFSTVSPAMHEEFDLAYLNPLYARFGLVYYGCCEPLHEKIDIVRTIPHLRKISMSPWVDQELGAACIGRDFVFSRKPSPAFLAGEWSPQRVEDDLRATVDCCRRHGCPLELILKDISTVNYQPQRLWQWAEIAARVVEG